MDGVILITDCDHPSVDIERSILESAGFKVRLGSCRTDDDVIDAGRGALALLVQYAPITRRVLEGLPDCRVIARYGVGLDTIDLEPPTAMIWGTFIPRRAHQEPNVCLKRCTCAACSKPAVTPRRRTKDWLPSALHLLPSSLRNSAWAASAVPSGSPGSL
jgi:hypothetical protein